MPSNLFYVVRRFVVVVSVVEGGGEGETIPGSNRDMGAMTNHHWKIPPLQGFRDEKRLET